MRMGKILLWARMAALPLPVEALEEEAPLQVLLKISVVLHGTWHAHEFKLLDACHHRKKISPAGARLAAAILAPCVALSGGESLCVW